MEIQESISVRSGSSTPLPLQERPNSRSSLSSAYENADAIVPDRSSSKNLEGLKSMVDRRVSTSLIDVNVKEVSLCVLK